MISTERSTKTLSIPCLVAVVTGMLMLAGPAHAAEAPKFFEAPSFETVHSTRVLLGMEFDSELPTNAKAEYSESESGPWTLVDSREESELNRDNERVLIPLGTEQPVAGGSPPVLLRHLKPATKYFARFLAKSSAGEAVFMLPFTTLPVGKPEIPDGGTNERGDSSFSCEESSDTTVFCSSTVETSGALSEYHFEYAPEEAGHRPAEDSSLWAPFTSGATGKVTVAEDFANPEATVSGLRPETTYYVRLRANNEKGEIVKTKFFAKLAGSPGEAESFRTLTAKPHAEEPSVRNVTATSAYLEARVGLSGYETHWRLEYATSENGVYAPVPGSEGSVSQTQAEAIPYSDLSLATALRFTALIPSTSYYVRLFAENKCAQGCGSATSAVLHFETSGPPAATTFAVHALDGESVRLLGAVNPGSVPTSEEQVITLEGAPTGGTFTLTFGGQMTQPIAFDAEAKAVEEALDELSTISAGNKGGEPAGPFSRVSVEGPAGGPYTVYFGGERNPLAEKDQPSIEAVSNLVLSGSVSVVVSQRGGEAYDAHYHFEYEALGGGGEPFVNATSTPEVDVGSGDQAKVVGYDLPALTPGAGYRYRIVATNTSPGNPVVRGAEQTLTVPLAPIANGEPPCSNVEFRVGASALLPDCRAYELLTPIYKEDAQEIFHYRGGVNASVFAGEDGEHAVLESLATSFGSSADSGQGPYLFSREEGNDWSITAGAPQPQTGIHDVLPQLYSSDLTQVAFESTYKTSVHGESPQVEYEVGPVGGPYTTVVSVPRGEVHGDEGWVAADGDFSNVVLQTQDRTLLGEPTGSKSGFDLYEYSGGALRQANVDSEGHTIGSCGASVARGYEEGAQAHQSSGPDTVSVGGQGVFFEGVPSKVCSEPSHLYVREGASEKTLDLGAARFLGANRSGSEVLLEKVSGGIHEIFLYDTQTAGETHLLSTQSALGELHVAAGMKLTALYFSSKEVLTPEAPAIGGKDEPQVNLYRYDIVTQNLQFLFQATQAENNPLIDAVTADGRYFYFGARTLVGVPGGGNLEQGKSKGLPSSQLYRYDNAESVVECMSCASSFDPAPKNEAVIDGVQGLPDANGGLPSYTAVSANGDYAFFTTTAALLPSDVDGEIPYEEGIGGEYATLGRSSPSSDVYEWRREGLNGCAQAQGCLALITSGRGGYLNLLLGSADEGRDVYVYTRSQLVPQDSDTAGDIYDVRVGGGMPPPPARPVECEGDACSAPPGAPNDATPSSLTFQGVGNALVGLPEVKPVVKPKPKVKPLCKAKAKRKCKTKPVRKGAHKARRARGHAGRRGRAGR